MLLLLIGNISTLKVAKKESIFFNIFVDPPGIEEKAAAYAENLFTDIPNLGSRKYGTESNI